MPEESKIRSTHLAMSSLLYYTASSFVVEHVDKWWSSVEICPDEWQACCRATDVIIRDFSSRFSGASPFNNLSL